MQRRIVGVDLIDAEVCKTTLIWLKRNNGSNCSFFGTHRPLPGWLAGPAHHVMSWAVQSDLMLGLKATGHQNTTAMILMWRTKIVCLLKGQFTQITKTIVVSGYDDSFGFHLPRFAISAVVGLQVYSICCRPYPWITAVIRITIYPHYFTQPNNFTFDTCVI